MAGFLFFSCLGYLIYMDAAALRALNPVAYAARVRRSPAFWGFAGALLFLLIVPVYLYRRAQFSRMPAPEPAPPLDSAPLDRPALPGPLTGFPPLSFLVGPLIAWVLAQAVLELLLTPAASWGERHQIDLQASVVASFLGYLVFVRIAQVMAPGTPWRERFFLNRPPGRLAVGVALAAVGGVAVAALGHAVQESRASIPDSPLSTALSTSSADAVACFTLLATLVGPLFEEVLFRGYFYGALKQARGPVIAFVVTAVGFTLMHGAQVGGDVVALSVIGLSSLLYTALRAGSGSVVWSAAAHYAYNVSVFLIPVTALWLANPPYAEFQFFEHRLSAEKKDALLERAMREHPTHAAAFNAAAWMFAEDNRRLPEALEIIDRALKLKPQKPAYLDTKAEILFKLGRIDEALAIEKRLVEREPEEEFYREQVRKFGEGKKAAKLNSASTPH
jgi:membrane protease YdiL (CAAX protease family)